MFHTTQKDNLTSWVCRLLQWSTDHAIVGHIEYYIPSFKNLLNSFTNWSHQNLYQVITSHIYTLTIHCFNVYFEKIISHIFCPQTSGHNLGSKWHSTCIIWGGELRSFGPMSYDTPLVYIQHKFSQPCLEVTNSSHQLPLYMGFCGQNHISGVNHILNLCF